jgi:murein DD-endopeptidase MepM/ murein hydrolase activator NlpD
MAPALRKRLLFFVCVLAAGTLVPGDPTNSNGAIRSVSFAPTPNSPSFGGVPGALPAQFHYSYSGAYTGWPIAPTHREHPVRGSFLDPRGLDDTGLSGYHFGIDISVDDGRPEAGAIKDFSHRVYAVESGVVDQPANNRTHPCLDRRLEIGHFDYWHVSPTVRQGQRITAGEQIGWSCRGVWHVHLSEWQRYRGVRVWVNPLHRGGRLVPYTDTALPVVNTLLFVTPPVRPWSPTVSLAQADTSRRLQPGDLRGPVELRANIVDPQSFLGFLTRNPAWPTDFTPYRISVRISERRNNRTVMSRVSFQADQLPQTPYIVHYAPGTIEDDNMQECVGPPQKQHCIGTYWFRPFSRFRQELWDTRKVANGQYEITVRAYDVEGNSGSKSVTVTVKN